MGQKILLHMLFWVTYVFLNGVLTCINFDSFDKNAFLAEFWSLPSKILLTYYIFYVVLPYFFEKRKVWYTVVLVFLGLAIAVILYRAILLYYIFPTYFPNRKGTFFNYLGVIQTVFDLFVTTAAALAIKLVRMQIRIREHEKRLNEEKLQSELKFLRAQTNPHFLFNTLNNIYVLAWKKSESTAEAVMKLSKIMRFMLYDCRKPRIEIKEEALVIQDFIELEKLRYTNRLKVFYTEKLDDAAQKIAPLLLLPFVENAFKHGAHGTDGQVEIHILLELNAGVLHFQVLNTVDGDEKGTALTAIFPNDEGHKGIGLKNVQRQLTLIYPNQFELKTGLDKVNHTYQIDLRIFKL